MPMADADEIIKQAQSLSLDDKKRVLHVLLESVKKEGREDTERRCRERFIELVHIMSEVSGYNEKWILGRSRASGLPYMRYMIAATLLRDGYNLSLVAKVFGCNHATISRGVSIINSVTIETGYSDIVHLFERFQSQI